MNKDKVRKILKFEKVIKKFCERIGIDQQAMLQVLYPERKSKTRQETLDSQADSIVISKERSRPTSQTRDQSSVQ